jgi:hypothetical protein
VIEGTPERTAGFKCKSFRLARAIVHLKLRVAVHAPVQILPPTPKASHPTSHIIVDKFFTVSGPFIQGFALFVRVLMPLVKADNSTFTARDMIQHRLSNWQRKCSLSNPAAAGRLRS